MRAVLHWIVMTGLFFGMYLFGAWDAQHPGELAGWCKETVARIQELRFTKDDSD